MERNLSLEIVEALARDRLHSRLLAKKLGTNHMTASRRLRELIAGNVIDFQVEGKNKVYSLRKTSEARNHLLMAEYYKLNRTLGAYPELRGVIEAVRNNRRIRLAVFFGSYAKGTVKGDSDIDLYVETSSRKMKKDIESLNTRLNVKIGPYRKASPLIREIERNHVIVRGVERYYEKSGFFG